MPQIKHPVRAHSLSIFVDAHTHEEMLEQLNQALNRINEDWDNMIQKGQEKVYRNGFSYRYSHDSEQTPAKYEAEKREYNANRPRNYPKNYNNNRY